MHHLACVSRYISTGSSQVGISQSLKARSLGRIAFLPHTWQSGNLLRTTSDTGFPLLYELMVSFPSPFLPRKSGEEFSLTIFYNPPNSLIYWLASHNFINLSGVTKTNPFPLHITQGLSSHSTICSLSNLSLFSIGISFLP